MPGILPMKVIKVGSSAQTRIAQACDRCRSKKIRCDGIRPSCTQCVNVGFECKTSDKLSRRAFPRGYTESLEERVRILEAEVRELKGLLDEKEEKIDMLSRIRARTSPSFSSVKRPSEAGSSPTLTPDHHAEACHSDDEESFKLTQSPTLVDDGLPNAFFMGTSSARPLVCAFKRKLQEQGKGSVTVNIDSFFSPESQIKDAPTPVTLGWAAPARMLSDKLVNIFFQEFSPLFPILHRPTFLTLYDEYTSTPEVIKDNKSIAQLFLVFSVASLSSQSGASTQDIQSFESQWKSAFETFATEDNVNSVQCLALATLYHMMKAESSATLRYKGQAVALAQRLGLHQSQKRFNYGALTVETRKKLFWSLYTLDCFSAAHLGLPTLFSEADVHCEMPVDADDEYVSEKGFLPSLPGESTKLSSALALFKLAKVLSRILKQLYPASTSQELSFRKIAELQDELDTWSSELAPHLRLQFEKDKPFTGVISSRSPLLSLAYHYTHTLISRPAVLASPFLQSRCNASILSLGLSSKRVIQIVQLLEERNMAFAFCLNKNEVLLQSAFGLLFQSLEIGSDSAVSREDSKLIATVMERVETSNMAGSREFRKIVDALLKEKSPRAHRSSVDNGRSQKQKGGSKRGLAAFAARLSTPNEKSPAPSSNSRKTTFPYGVNSSQLSLFGGASPDGSTLYQQAALFARSEPSLSPHEGLAGIVVSGNARKQAVPNLDYMPFNEKTPLPLALANEKDASSPADWERILSNLDNGPQNIYDTIYGGPGAQPPSLGDYSSLASSSPKGLRSSHSGDALRNSSCSPNSLWTSVPDFRRTPHIGVPQSVMSFGSDETPLMNGDDNLDTTLILDSPVDAFSSNMNLPGVNSPGLMGPNNDVDLFGSLDFGLGV